MMVYYLLVINVITFFTYTLDKWLAIKGKRRISEFNLLLLSIIGGSFLGIIAMYLVHHKTKKIKFVIINVISIIFWFYVIFLVLCNILFLKKPISMVY